MRAWGRRTAGDNSTGPAARKAGCAACCAILVACGEPSPDPDADTPDASGFFTDVTDELRIVFAIDRAAAGDYFMPDSMNAGVALLDFDNDGRLDFYLVNGFRDSTGAINTPQGANRLLRQSESGRFVDVTAEAGVGHTGYGMGVATGDYDNDGDVDLYITNYGPDCLYRNNDDGTFTDASELAGIDGDHWSASAAFLDYNNDGWLDLYVTHYVAHDPLRPGADLITEDDYPAPAMYKGVADTLYRNQGDGTFIDASAETGIASASGKGLGVICLDLNQDGAVDIYVANDGEPNFAWISDANGAFVNRAVSMGLAVNMHGRPEAGMGVADGDIDGDGRSELFVTHLVQETNTLYRTLSPDVYDDATLATGTAPVSIDRTGFGVAFLDIERDGDLDLVIANGRVSAGRVHLNARLNDHWNRYAEPNTVMLNDGAGVFVDAGDLAGAFASHVEVGRGLALGDIDNDGDQDIVVTNGNGTVRVYRNDADPAGHWLAVRAVDPRLNRDALGATIAVTCGDLLVQRRIRTAHSYLSASDPRAFFGLGKIAAIDHLVIHWPDGLAESFAEITVDQFVTLTRGQGRPLDVADDD